jgi:hypothetical protein
MSPDHRTHREALVNRRVSILLPCFLALALVAGSADAQRARRIALKTPEVVPQPTRPLPENGNIWECSYAGYAIMCQLRTKVDPQAPNYLRVADQTIDPRLPEEVGTIRNYPQLLEGKTVSIPVIGIPIELDFVAELADSVMCNRRPDCGVVFAR